MNKIKAFLSDFRVQLALRILVAAIFILSSSTKLFNIPQMADSIDNYKMVPKFMIMPMAIIVPWLQMICAVMLLIDVYVKTSAFILSGLLTMFTIAIIQAWIRKIEISCGCFDMLIEWGEKVGPQAVIRDLIFLALTGTIFLFAKDGFNFYGLFRKKN